jgi:D-xylulose reductase
LAVGVHAATKVQVQPGDLAIVMGAGPIGMVTVLAALAAGCSRVIVSDIHEPKLELARKLGPVLAVDVRRQSLRDVVDRETDGWGVDVLFECSGHAPAMSEMFDLVCPGGKVALVGIPLQAFPYDVSKAQVKEIRVENVFRYAHVYPRAVGMLASGRIDVKPLITNRFAFEESVEAFDFAKAMPPASVKVQIEMPM